MKGKHTCLLLILLLLLLPGCSNRLDLEDAALSLGTGLDLSADNSLLVYTYYPVFDKNSKKKTGQFGVKTSSLRQSEGENSAIAGRALVARKTQVIFLGKKLLENENWFLIMDSYYRDTKNATTAYVVLVDGAVSEVMSLNLPETPRIVEFVSELVHSSSIRGESVATSVQEFHRQMFEKGITPSISMIHKNKKVEMVGTALLNKNGKYVQSLNTQETALLKILQRTINKRVSLSVQIPAPHTDNDGSDNVLSFTADHIKTNITTALHHDQFKFDIQVKMNIYISEKGEDVSQGYEELKPMIDQQLNRQVEDLLQKFQRSNIDPIGLGLYARAYEYEKWKETSDKWAAQMAKADIHVSVNTEIHGKGPVKY